MQKPVTEKNKYFLYNENNHILCFSYVQPNDRKVIFVPSQILNGSNIDPRIDEFSQKIISLLSKEDNLIFLHRTKIIGNFFESENFKLVKKQHEMIKNYYSCFKVFNENEQEKLLNICSEYGYIPEYLTIEQLMETKKEENRTEVYVDKALYEPLAELQMKLEYRKY